MFWHHLFIFKRLFISKAEREGESSSHRFTPLMAIQLGLGQAEAMSL